MPALAKSAWAAILWVISLAASLFEAEMLFRRDVTSQPANQPIVSRANAGGEVVASPARYVEMAALKV